MRQRRKAKITCFAYGSNMLSARMRHPERVPSARPIGVGYITGHRLSFDKVSKDGSGKCDAEQTQEVGDRVYGVLYSVDQSQKYRLDGAEGLNAGYKEKPVEVVTARGVTPAVVYCATTKDFSLKPYHWYKALVVAGAIEHRLPFGYVELLRTVESLPDQDAARRIQHERLLTTAHLTTRSARRRRKRRAG